MKENICCVTYGELSSMVREVLKEYEGSGVTFQMVEGLREENLDRINRAILNGAEVIIAGGANAQVARGHFNVPVVDYRVTLADYVSAVHRAYEIGGMPALVSYRSTMPESLKDLLKQFSLPVEEIIYEDTEELEEKVRKSSANLIVGNALAVDVAGRLGLKSLLLYSGGGSIRETVEEARTLVREIRREREKNEFAKAMMKYSPNGIIYLNGENRIVDCNQSLHDMLGRPRSIILGRCVEEVLPECLAGHDGGVESVVIHINEKKVLERWVDIADGNGNRIGSILILTLFSDYKKAEVDYRKKQQELRTETGFTARYSLKDIIGSSCQMKMCTDEAALFSQTDASVLIYGETGVGKELFAQGMHNEGERKHGPFVAINCAALPENLLESELFGYDEGAFTGGRKGGKKGLFELADSGSLFLDEIGEIPPTLQARLLRVLQEKEIMHVGGNRVIPVDVRIITATNKNLEQMTDKEFRRDLLYRLNVLELHIPPLRKREEDVIELFRFYLSKKMGMDSQRVELSAELQDILKLYSWKGNIRELQNVCERFCLYMEKNTRFNEKYARRCVIKAIGEDKLVQDIAAAYEKTDKLELIQNLKRLLFYNNDQVGQALGMSRTTLWRVMNKK